MDFRTTLRPAPNEGIMHHTDRVMLLGSCFSDNMGAKLQGAMINAMVNPVGTLYNPMSIAASVDRVVQNRPERGMDLFRQGDVWNSFDFHSRFSLPDKQQALDRMNRAIDRAHHFLAQCETLFVTLGTAVVYRLRETGQVVANCHKVPQHQFTRQMADASEVAQTLTAMTRQLHAFNPALRVIFTVSPIRHVADGLEVNSLSKATLRVAIGQVTRQFPQFTGYFPAYEVMLDDLRDYRFYAADMVHPSEVAIEYMWQLLQATYFDDASCQAIARCERVSKRLQHHPMSSNPAVVERFNADTRSVVRNLARQYPHIAALPAVAALL